MCSHTVHSAEVDGQTSTGTGRGGVSVHAQPLLLGPLLRLVRHLREAGVAVSSSEVIDATQALQRLDLVDRLAVRSALVATLAGVAGVRSVRVKRPDGARIPAKDARWDEGTRAALPAELLLVNAAPGGITIDVEAAS